MAIQIERFSRSQPDRQKAAEVLGAAFITNPALVKGLGGTDPSHLRKATKFYEHMLKTTTGDVMVAKEEDTVLGVMQTLPSERCQPSKLDMLRTMPSLLFILGRSMPTAARWFGAWGKEDPPERHIHLGPIGVHPDRQGSGIGTLMMKHYVDQLDTKGDAGYLETDKDINVRFYERFGFKVTKELPVLGVTTWLMWREPGGTAD